MVFGQLYNQLFYNDVPTIQLKVKDFQQFIENSDNKIQNTSLSTLAMPKSLKEQLLNDGILSVKHNNQELIYLINQVTQQVHIVGPLDIYQPQDNNIIGFLAFYSLLGLVVLLLIRPVFRDLSKLQKAAKSFAEHPRKINVHLPKKSSITPLSDTFTSMSERIEQFIGLHQDLSRIISHEIRTPLTRMRFALSLSDEPTCDQLEHDINEIESRLEQYLSFARIEHQNELFQQQRINLGAIVKAEIDKFSLYDTITFNFKNNVQWVNCESTYMAIAIQNLLINATKYAKNTITLCNQLTYDGYELSVEDDGMGLPVNADALINPFQQGQDDNLASGYGLGLYIVKRIITWHGGTITLKNSPQTGGALIILRWPRIKST